MKNQNPKKVDIINKLQKQAMIQQQKSLMKKGNTDVNTSIVDASLI